MESRLIISAENQSQNYLLPTRNIRNERLLDYLLNLPLPHVFFNVCKDQEMAMSFLLKSKVFPSSRRCKSC